MKSLFFLLVFIQFYSAIGQIIDGIVTYDQDKKPVRKARIDFVCERDTFYTTYTDEKGYFEYCGKYCQKQFTIIPSKKDFYGYNSTGVLNDTIYEYTYELGMTRIFVEDFCPFIFFELNRSAIVSFDAERLRTILEEYPMMCIKTNIALYPDESEKLIKGRIKEFKKLLIRCNIRIDRIEFAEEFTCFTPREDYGCQNLPFLSFMVTSMEGDCLQQR